MNKERKNKNTPNKETSNEDNNYLDPEINSLSGKHEDKDNDADIELEALCNRK